MQACFVSEMFSTRIFSQWIDQFAWNLPNLKDDQLEDLEEQVFLLTLQGTSLVGSALKINNLEANIYLI